VGLIRHLYLRNILNMKLSPIPPPNSLYRPETFADKTAHLPTPDRVLEFAQEKVVGAVHVPLREDYPVPDIRIECDSHRRTSSHRFRSNNPSHDPYSEVGK